MNECSICFDDLIDGDWYQCPRQLQDPICYSCLKASMFRNGRYHGWARCCNTHGRIGKDVIEKILTREEMIDLCYEDTKISISDDFPRCPLNGCNTICKSKDRRVHCSKCNSFWCLKCNQPWRLGHRIVCPGMDPSLAKVCHIDVKKGWTSKKCPNCGVVVTKNGGCPHMTCIQCKHEYCWKCNKEYPHCRHVNTDYYDDYY